MTCRWSLVFVTFFAGCLDLGEYPQGPGGDAGSARADGGGLTVDGGVGAPDSGFVDGGLSEPPPDSGVSSDAGPNGERDAGAVVADAGLTTTDGGIRTDGGTTTPDAGSLTDAGGPRADAGALDSGSSDAGLPPTEPPCSPNATLTGTERLILEMKAEDWLVLPNTRFSDSCVRDSNLAGRDGCTAVITAWSGGAFDDGHRQLLVTGGGHLNYFGNEVYGFSLANRSWSVLRNPTPLLDGYEITEPMYDFSPASRHTYGGLVYVNDLNQLVMLNGATSPNGTSTQSRWGFSLSTHEWVSHTTWAPNEGPLSYAVAAAYNSADHELYSADGWGVWVSSLKTGTWERRADLPPMERYLSAVFVPSRSWFIVAGGPTLFVYDTKRDQDLTTSFTMSGDLSVISNPGVGLAYDPITDSLVAWGGGVVGVMNLDERVWVLRHTWQTPAADETVQGGTFGRFRYVAYLNAFILVNGPTSDVMIFKLTTGCGR